MKMLNAIFYFKDDTILNVIRIGIYNNKTLDMNFKKCKANYEESELFAEKLNIQIQKLFKFLIM